jgi:hypothetical protein
VAAAADAAAAEAPAVDPPVAPAECSTPLCRRNGVVADACVDESEVLRLVRFCEVCTQARLAGWHAAEDRYSHPRT